MTLTNTAKEKPGRSASTSPAGGPMARERTIRDVFIIAWIDTAVTLFCVHVDGAAQAPGLSTLESCEPMNQDEEIKS